MSHFLDRLTYLSRRREPFADGHGELRDEDRMWEEGYRQRWQHDKIVRSTHGVNCTGSCSWKIYVKSGVVTWETQQTHYPRTRPGMPTTSRAAARAVPPTAGTSTAPAGSNIRWCAAVWSRRGARRAKPSLRSRPGRRSSATPIPRVRTNWCAAVAALCGRAGTRSARSSPPIRSRPGDRIASSASRRSRRCRWSPTPRAPAISV